jgi:hypothetical protein
VVLATVAGCASPNEVAAVGAESRIPEASGVPPPAPGTPEGERPPVAVVELFTSEGCSSCPPADDVLRELSASPEAGRSVFALSFHVDYWDDLGWPDPFADRGSTARQRAYAKAFGGSGLYTPQMIVGGREAFVGSDRARAQRSVAAALSRPAAASVAITAAAHGDDVNARYRVTGAPGGATLHLALVESSTTVRVLRGENAGRTLRHDNVVRAFRSAPLDEALSGTTTLERRGGPAPRSGALAVIAYVQRPTLEIVGAAQAAVVAGAAP